VLHVIYARILYQTKTIRSGYSMPFWAEFVT